MPGTLMFPHVASVESSVPTLGAERLTFWERLTALYASDMPTDYRWRKEEGAELIDWIAQGAARLGFRELYRTASDTAHYRRLWLDGLATASQTAAHERRFPDSVRLGRVESALSLLILWSHLGAPESGQVGDESFSMYRAYGDDIDEVSV